MTVFGLRHSCRKGRSPRAVRCAGSEGGPEAPQVVPSPTSQKASPLDGFAATGLLARSPKCCMRRLGRGNRFPLLNRRPVAGLCPSSVPRSLPTVLSSDQAKMMPGNHCLDKSCNYRTLDRVIRFRELRASDLEILCCPRFGHEGRISPITNCRHCRTGVSVWCSRFGHVRKGLPFLVEPSALGDVVP